MPHGGPAVGLAPASPASLTAQSSSPGWWPQQGMVANWCTVAAFRQGPAASWAPRALRNRASLSPFYRCRNWGLFGRVKWLSLGRMARDRTGSHIGLDSVQSLAACNGEEMASEVTRVPARPLWAHRRSFCLAEPLVPLWCGQCFLAPGRFCQEDALFRPGSSVRKTDAFLTCPQGVG